MLFMVRMDVAVPHDVDQAALDALKAAEKTQAQALQRAGTWRHLWRIAGRYANVSIFDVADAGQLHEILLGLPLFPFMSIEVTALCRHPSAIDD
ncbi:muconolactone Delta-isomerase [Sphingomonas sp. ERG5]|uniref:muconolactone Delta-isomerase n=1 Tax=Sphingomonas sp. ERG5 TaxID=1381597 RepID=UPI00054BC57D|nr:muconolactone Delta-isomerase [Sphingomonas sp. ERG5]